MLQVIKSEVACGNAIAGLNFHENSVTASLQIWTSTRAGTCGGAVDTPVDRWLSFSLSDR
jgi:hypothetical protein